MKIVGILLSVALLASVPGATSAQQRTQPGPGTELPPLDQAPQKPVTAERERYQKEMRAEVEAWEQRVEHFLRGAQQAGTRQARNDADEVNRAFRALKNQWQNLVQTQGPNWETLRERFEQARANMDRAWASATRQ